VFSAASEGRQPNAADAAGHGDNCASNQITKIRNSVVLEMNSFNDPSFVVESTPVISGTATNQQVSFLGISGRRVFGQIVILNMYMKNYFIQKLHTQRCITIIGIVPLIFT
jgi:hypothetical protein